MIEKSEYDDIIVTVAHPWGNGYPTLATWIATGPDKERPLVGIIAAKRRSTGEPVDMSEIPLEYHNSRKSRQQQRLGRIPMPWGPPPDDVQFAELGPDIPPDVRRTIEEAGFGGRDDGDPAASG